MYGCEHILSHKIEGADHITATSYTDTMRVLHHVVQQQISDSVV
jgi:hypothetical protein